MRNALHLALSIAAPVLAFSAGAAHAENTHINPSNGFISQAVKVPAGSEMLYVSGMTPPALNAGAPAGTPPEFGDTKTQVQGVLKRIEAALTAQGFSWDDVVMMRVLLVGDPKLGGKMDFAGMMAAYTEVYGARTKKPARITSQAAALVSPGMLAEIEVQAAKAAK